MPTNFDEIQKLFDKAIAESDAALRGKHKDTLAQLLALSPAEIDEITPDSTDTETYAQLIAIVETASRKNVSQAMLKRRIKDMGEVALKIAKKVPKLAALLA